MKILVVEDSSAMRAFVRASLEEAEHAEVFEASNGFEALRLLPRDQFDVVVVDINMPDVNGLELISFMRSAEAHRDTPVVLISTEASTKDRERGLALGANTFLQKPFGSGELVDAVRYALRHGGAPGNVEHEGR